MAGALAAKVPTASATTEKTCPSDMARIETTAGTRSSRRYAEPARPCTRGRRCCDFSPPTPLTTVRGELASAGADGVGGAVRAGAGLEVRIALRVVDARVLAV